MIPVDLESKNEHIHNPGKDAMNRMLRRGRTTIRMVHPVKFCHNFTTWEIIHPGRQNDRLISWNIPFESSVPGEFLVSISFLFFCRWRDI